MDERIKRLVTRYNNGEATKEELAEIESLLEQALINLSDLEALQQIDTIVMNMKVPSPSPALDNRVYQMLSSEKKTQSKFSWTKFLAWPEFAPRFALASLILIIGVVTGYLLRSPAQKIDQIELLSSQVNELKEMMMLTLLEKESATDRLKAVSLSQEIDYRSKQVARALLKTLNHDDNVNVRLAALEALQTYARDSEVREDLVRSITKQESPLVQIALAELMVALQEKSSVKELKKVLQDERTPGEVKNKIKESIDVLI